jgi:hypothetical protein
VGVTRRGVVGWSSSSGSLCGVLDVNLLDRTVSGTKMNAIYVFSAGVVVCRCVQHCFLLATSLLDCWKRVGGALTVSSDLRWR